MAWVRLEPDAPTHPKIIRVGIAGFGLFVAGLCYANHYLTDGFIPATALAAVFPGVQHRRALSLAVNLVEAGLWEVGEGGWRIHDFHHYQPTRTEAIEQERVRYERNSAGGRARSTTATRVGGRFIGRQPTHQPQAGNRLDQPHQPDTSTVSVSVSVPKEDLTTLSGLAPDALSPNGGKPNYREQSREVLAFLNAKTGRSFRAVDTNLRLIEARLKAGATVDNCRGVISRKVRAWATDPKMAPYLRPETLFNATKFESYLGEREAGA